MGRMNMLTPAILVLVCFVFAASGYAAEDVGAVVALRGNALIARETKVIEAKLKDGIQLKDTVETSEKARAKMLFIDDSVLTMGERSKVEIREFLFSKDKGGKSIFNLIDGKMRSVVGKSEFEVQTPTAVAAARGTVIDFETGMIEGKFYTKIICYEGVVDIRSVDPAIGGRITLRPGMAVTVVSGQPLPAPTVVPAAPTSAAGSGGAGVGKTAESLPAVQAPPVIKQPPASTSTPVNVGIKLPPGAAAPPPGSIRVGW